MTEIKRLTDAEIADSRQYAEQRLAAPDHWSPSEIELVTRNARWIATVDYWRKRYEDEAVRYTNLDQQDRVPLLSIVKALRYCLTRAALRDIAQFLACELQNDKAAEVFQRWSGPLA